MMEYRRLIIGVVIVPPGLFDNFELRSGAITQLLMLV
jgi:hypothetical protein